MVASYTDGQGTHESVISAGLGPVANVNDAPTGSVSISGTPAEDEVLNAGNNLADEDGLGTIGYQWQRNGVDILGATSTTYTLTQTDVGTSIRVVASYTDGQGTHESVISAGLGPVANVNDAPVGAPTILGIAQEDQTLTADTSEITDEDGLGTFSFQWLRDGVAVDGATQSTYTLGDADVGTQLRVQVSYIDGQGTFEGPLISNPTLVVTNINNVPVISGVDTGAVTEDLDPNQNGLLETAGSLLIVDPDVGEAFFRADVVTGSHGNLTIDATGNWIYVTDNMQAVIQSLQEGSTLTETFTVLTVDGTTHAISITITGVNDNPTAADDHFTVDQGETLNVDASGVLVNDSDVEGDPLSVAVVGGPAHGTLTLNPDGSFAYMPDVGFAGIDSFNYVAEDGHGAGGIATVTIDVVRRVLPPQAPHNDPISDERLPERDEPTETESDDPVTQDDEQAGNKSLARPNRGKRVHRTGVDHFKSAQEIIPPNQRKRLSVIAEEKLDFAADFVRLNQLEAPKHDSERPDHQRSFVHQIVDVSINQLLHQFDTLTDDLNHATHLRSVTITGVVGLTTAATAGHAVLALRSGYFAMTAMASIPSWKAFDLVPILDFQDRNRKAKKKKKKRTDPTTGVWSDELLQNGSTAACAGIALQ